MVADAGGEVIPLASGAIAGLSTGETMTTTVHVRHIQGEHDFSEYVTCTYPALNAVLFDFNPAGSHDVTTIKALSAALIQKMRDHQAKAGTPPEQKRVAAIAITQMELTQMAAVEALFAR
jgi:hypothetical protein